MKKQKERNVKDESRPNDDRHRLRYALLLQIAVVVVVDTSRNTHAFQFFFKLAIPLA